MKHKIYLFSVLMTALLLSACAGKNYDGPTRPKSEVASITRDRGAWPINIGSLNGKPPHRPGGGWTEGPLQVLPGPVELIVYLNTGHFYGRTVRRITFNAVGGGEYVLDYWWNKDETWGAYIMEKSTKTKIAEGVVYDQNDIQKDR